MKRHIPNLVTLLNLLCGSIAVFYAIEGQFEAVALFVCLGILFDFFDGLLARQLNVQSPLGLQLDSLADMVTSGLVPGIVMCQLMDIAWSGHILGGTWGHDHSWLALPIAPVAFIGLLITLASAYRLAKFNIDEDQQSYFKGLPTPANTLFIISLPLVTEFQDSELLVSLISNPYVLIGITVLSCYMLNASMKLFALKFKNFSLADNTYRYVLLVVSILLMILLKFIAIPLIIVLYIVLSILKNARTS